MRWNLDKLYVSFDSDEFKSDFEGLKQTIEKVNQWAEENLCNIDNALEKIEQFINMSNDFEKYDNLGQYASLFASVSSTDERALKVLDNLDNIYTDLKKPSVMFKSFLKQIDNLDAIIDASPLLKDHTFFLNERKEEAQYMLSEAEEIIVAKLQVTGSNSWTKLHEQLTSTILVDINLDGEDKKLPLPMVRNLAEDARAEVRKTAYDAELKAYEKIDLATAFSLNSIKGEVLTTAKLRGYSSPLEMTLINSRMDLDTLNSMLSAMQDFLPVFSEYFKAKARLLGHEGGLPFYDLFAPIGDTDMRFTYPEAQDFVVKNFSDYNKKLGDFARYAFDNKWVDAEIRENKQGGAFCSNIHYIRESRIMANFSGSFGDVLTLAHELGHAYHGDCLNDESSLNSDYSMPIAETASTFCETIITNAALKTASQHEALVILENGISGMAQVIVDIYSRYLFETELFSKRQDGVLSSGELKEMMLTAQKEAYGDGLDHEFLHPYMWVCKTHYYHSEANFYNFPYAYGLLFSKGLYSLYLEKGAEFPALYDKLLSQTGKNSLKDVALIAGIDVTKKDFWVSSLKVIEKEIQHFISLSSTTSL